jgi:hypothetical protein
MNISSAADLLALNALNKLPSDSLMLETNADVLLGQLILKVMALKNSGHIPVLTGRPHVV